MDVKYLRVTEKELKLLNKNDDAAIFRRESLLEEYEKFEDEVLAYRVLLLDEKGENILAIANLEQASWMTPKQAWKELGLIGGCTQKQFINYVHGAHVIMTYTLQFIHYYDEPIPVGPVCDLIDDL